MEPEHILDEHVLDYVAASDSRRHAVGFLDGGILLSIASGIYVLIMLSYIPPATNWLPTAGPPALQPFLWLLAYRLIGMVLLHGTPGMYLLKVRLLTVDHKRPSFGHRLLAALYVLPGVIDYYTKAKRP